MPQDWDELSVGPSPCGEDCVQVGAENYCELSRKECRRYIELLTKIFAPIPANASFFVKTNPHDFGTYHEVDVRHDLNDLVATQWAYHVDNNLPEHWSDDTPIPFTPEPEEPHENVMD